MCSPYFEMHLKIFRTSANDFHWCFYNVCNTPFLFQHISSVIRCLSLLFFLNISVLLSIIIYHLLNSPFIFFNSICTLLLYPIPWTTFNWLDIVLSFDFSCNQGYCCGSLIGPEWPIQKISCSEVTLSGNTFFLIQLA